MSSKVLHPPSDCFHRKASDLSGDLNGVIEKYIESGSLTNAEILGCIEGVKLQFYLEQFCEDS
jgi:hypothetical protein